MKRVGIGTLAAVFAFGFALSAYACDKEKSACGKSATLAAAKVTTETEKSGGCSKGTKADEAAVARAMKMLPQMTYKVGDLETPCCYTARKASEESGSPILYMVGDDGYTCKKTAMNKLAAQMTAEMPKLAQVVSSVDGEQVDCFIKAAALASEKDVKVKYVLAGVEFNCRESASAVAAKVAEKLKADGIACDGTAVTASAYCSKSSKASCCAEAKTASASDGCCKSKAAAEASTASATGCGAKAAEAKTAAASSDGCCAKSKAAAVAAASAGGCDKAKAEAATASATESGCSKSKAATASSGCGKSNAEAATASASEGGCSKSKAATASSGCSKSKADAATASASEGGCSKSKAATASGGHGTGSNGDGKATIADHFAADPAAAEALEETEELSRAKQMVRQIVDFVSTQQES